MKGSVQYHSQSKRYYVQLYWQRKHEKFWTILWNREWIPIYDQRTGQKLLGAIQTDIDKGTFFPGAYRPGNPLSIGKYYETWIGCLDVTKKTRQDYRTAIRNYALPFFGEDKDIRQFHKSDLVRFYKSIDKSVKWKYNIMGALKAMFHFAYDDEKIIKVPPFPPLKQGLKQTIEYLTLEQQEKVLAEIPARHQPVFRFAMEYGLRIGEARAIMHDCVKEGRLYIRRAFSENELRETTKTGELREYDLTPYAKNIIDTMPVTSNTFVFVREDGKAYTNKNLNEIWHQAADKVGIKIKLYNAIRHSLGCQLLDEGKDLSFVQEVLGHTRPDMTRRYAKRTSHKVAETLSARRNIVSFRSTIGRNTEQNG
ncbi:MAG: tyrosine-type recombinase/integrase [Syntrophaceae bacterium]|nr:tyrosine-type recombinase/integrase [Syntrophaceae bacterium]